MHRIKPFFNGSKNEDVPEQYHRVRYIRDSCKVFSDLLKSDKDFSNKCIDNDISKAFREFRVDDVACAYQSSSSVLNTTIDDLITIHEYIDAKRKDWLERFRALTEVAKEKQLAIRQSMSETRDCYDRAVRKVDAAESSFKKFQNKSDRPDRPNAQTFEERSRELEDTRNECEQARSVARDIYTTETYRIACEEHAITRDIFAQYLFEEQNFYNDIQQYLANQIPEIQRRLDDDKYAPIFHCDLAEHCLRRIQHPIAYPIRTCIRLLKHSVKEEGLFRVASAHNKQKRLAAELDLQLIDEKVKLQELGYDPHVAANALKQYLRELPECLLTDALFPQWNEIPSLSTDEARIQRIGQLITQLPKVNYDNLGYLIYFLSRVAEHSSVNKMTAVNLGICIGCSLLYPKDQSTSLYTNCSSVIELMIVHHKQFFPPDNQGDLRMSLRNSKESLLDIDSPVPSPKPSAKHRPAPPPPVNRALLLHLEPSYIGETSTELEKNSASSPSNSLERERRFSGSLSGFLDRLSYRRQRSSTSTKEPEDISMSPTSNDGVHNLQSTSDLNNSNDMTLPDQRGNTPREITEF